MHLGDSGVLKYYVETTDGEKLSDRLYCISNCPCSYSDALQSWWKGDGFFPAVSESFDLSNSVSWPKEETSLEKVDSCTCYFRHLSDSSHLNKDAVLL